MDLKITDKVELPVYKNCYELVINFMEGDADNYHEVVTRVDWKHKEELLDLLNVVLQCLKTNRREYNLINGYSKYFGECSQEEYDKLTNIFHTKDNYTDSILDHPYNCDYDVYDSFLSYELYYYDEYASKFNVEII